MEKMKGKIMKESFKNFVHEFVENAQAKIKELVKTELANEEKKAKLDEAMIAFVTMVLDKVKINGLVRLLIKKLVMPCIDDLTQVIYDLLKAKIDKVTIEPATKEPAQTKSKAKADEDAGENK